MKVLCLAAAISILTATTPGGLHAHALLKRPFQKKYGFKSVTCYACHVKGRDKSGKPLGKEVLNELGIAMKRATGNGQITMRLNDVKKADAETRKKVQEQIAQEFLLGLEQIEKKMAPDGEQTWGELIKSGKIAGVTKKKDG